ncbi:hypothetical protein CKA32_006655 [Geitlerinema sp. FC II]|nr:hypothetical protein CKA32_006655 [Geitlerinema sp. FC II]
MEVLMNSQEFLRQYQLGKRDFSGIVINDLKIKNLDSDIENISLRSSKLNLAHLSGVTFINCDLQGTLLNGAYLHNCNFINCNLKSTELNGSQLRFMLIRDSDFSKSSIKNAICRRTLIKSSYILKVNFQRTTFLEIEIHDSDLSGVDLTDCKISDFKSRHSCFLKAILKAVNFHPHSVCNDFSFADLRQADLSYMDLQNSNFVGADLREANLSYSNLQRVDMTLARLKKTNLEGANLKGSRGLRFFKIKPSGHSDVKSIRILEGAFLKNTRLPHGNLIEEAQYQGKSISIRLDKRL